MILNDINNWGERTMPSSYTLGPRFESLIKELVESGRYNNASEVVRDGLRLLEDREQLRTLEIAELRDLVEEGRRSGLSEENGDTFLDRSEAKYQAMAERRRG